VGDDVEVGVLVERVERQPQAEAFGERNLFLDRLAGVDFLADAVAFQVFLEVLGHQVPAVRGGVDQHVVRRGGNRAVEHHLERLEGGVAGVEREVVAEDDETLRAVFDQFDDVGRSTRSSFSTSMTRRPLWRILVEQRLDQR
jgi:hypothetical protein